MTLRTKLATAAIAGALVVVSAAAAMAAPAIIRFDTRLYANPGGPQIGWVRGGQRVDATECRRGYCWVAKPGRDGFVRASAIDWRRPGPPPGWYDRPHRPGYPIHPGGPGFCIGNWHGNICVNP